MLTADYGISGEKKKDFWYQQTLKVTDPHG